MEPQSEFQHMKPTNPKDAVAVDRLPLELVPDTANAGAALAFMEGALKYGRYNWRVAGVRASVYVGALRRHLMRWWNGEDIDPDSELHHLYKLRACVDILIDALACDKLIDDRPPRVPHLDDEVAAMTEQVHRLRERHKDKNPHQYTIEDSEQRAPNPFTTWKMGQLIAPGSQVRFKSGLGSLYDIVDIDPLSGKVQLEHDGQRQAGWFDLSCLEPV